jgi:hypothetical protein
MVNGSPMLVWSFVALTLLVAATVVFGVYRSASSPDRARRDGILAIVGTALWMGGTYALATTGRLSFTSRPPTMMVLIALTIALAIYLGLSKLGARLASGIPLVALVAIQGFRFPLELMLHRAYVEGLMPIQMSFSGFNFDIITGLGALLVAGVLAWKPRSLVLVRIWNTAGVVLLANILTIAIVSTPTPLRLFHNDPANVWIAQAPWVWLPTVLVFTAIAGHIIVYRRLRSELSELAGRPSRSHGLRVTSLNP